MCASRAREDLRAANLRINQMLADYGDVVPRREFDMIETSFRVSCVCSNWNLILLFDSPSCRIWKLNLRR